MLAPLEFQISGHSALCDGVRVRGFTVFNQLAEYVRALPYGRTTSRSPCAVLHEGRGTCSSKHQLLAAVAHDSGHEEVRLVVGIYDMREENTPGVGLVLSGASVTSIPEAHCYLSVNGERLDFTGLPPGCASPFAALVAEHDIPSPSCLPEHKMALHKAALATWAATRGMSFEQAWSIREACIAALARHHENDRRLPLEQQDTRLSHTLAEHIRATLAEQPPPIFVAICGWADTGKSTLAEGLSAALETLGVDADWISTDAFLKDRAERNALGITGYSHLSLDSTLLASAIDHFAGGEAFLYRPYDNRSGTRREEPRTVTPRQVLVVEGIHALHPRIEKRFLLKIFIDSDESTLREMRRRANIFKRGMSLDDAAAGIQREWEDFCSMILPQKRLANLVIRVNQEYEYSYPIDLCAQPGRHGASSTKRF